MRGIGALLCAIPVLRVSDCPAARMSLERKPGFDLTKEGGP